MVRNARHSRGKRLRIWALNVAVALAVVTMALVAPSRAGVLVHLDPTGGGGANPAVTINAPQLSWAPGNMLAVDAVNFGVFNTRTPVTIEYQALLGGIAGITLTGGTVAVAGQQNDTTPANGGDIVLAGIDTGRELFVTASFRVRLAFHAETKTLTATFAGGTPNNVTIYNAPAGTFKNFAGLGSSPPADAMPILTGSVITSGIEGNFRGTFTVTSTTPEALDQYAGDTAAQTFWAGTNTVSGTGSFFVPVVVNSVNGAFLQSTPTIIALSFPSIASAFPFNSVEPSQLVLGMPTTGKLGTVNGLSGPDILFQAQAANDFSE